jgi:hypothetical protein
MAVSHAGRRCPLLQFMKEDIPLSEAVGSFAGLYALSF